MNLLLDQPVFHRPRLFLEPGNLGLELLVLILEMAQAGLQLARRRTAGQILLSLRAATVTKRALSPPSRHGRQGPLSPGASRSDRSTRKTGVRSNSALDDREV